MVPGKSWGRSGRTKIPSRIAIPKNHACILIWSCGNESYGGNNIFDMSNLFRSLDSSRLVHYEGIVHDRRYNATSDMESQMYPTVADIEAFLEVHRDKPFICCEYAHAMGNSCGALHKYTDLTENEPLYQGGFIWDYIDQGLINSQELLNGQPGAEYLAYGGDFGDQPTDYNFCGNGLVYADRTNTPKMQEVKFCYQDYTLLPSENGIIVKNKSLFTNTSVYTLQVDLLREGVLLTSTQRVVDAAPGIETNLPLPLALPDQAGEYLINASLLLKEATSWADAGHEVAFGQAIVPISGQLAQPGDRLAKPDDELTSQPFTGQNVQQPFEQAELDTSASLLPVTVINSDINIGVKGVNFHAIFSRSAAGLVSYRFKDRELLKDVPQINFWRAPTDNDRGCKMPFDYAIWKAAGKYASLENVSLEEGPFSASITFDYRLPTSDRAAVKACYTVSGDGTIAVELTYGGQTNPLVPEFGLMLALPADLARVEYYGLGPDENYCDRQTGARMGCFSYDVQDNLARYLKPQECGNRCHVQRAALFNAAGTGLLFTSEDMEFSALPYTPHELENARHHFELPPVCQTVVRCNAGQMGVGGDNSWGARTQDEYLLRLADEQTFRFSFRGI
jgi:beta-galactosidase